MRIGNEEGELTAEQMSEVKTSVGQSDDGERSESPRAPGGCGEPGELKCGCRGGRGRHAVTIPQP